jgi:hypothetical protein
MYIAYLVSSIGGPELESRSKEIFSSPDTFRPPLRVYQTSTAKVIGIFSSRKVAGT